MSREGHIRRRNYLKTVGVAATAVGTTALAGCLGDDDDGDSDGNGDTDTDGDGDSNGDGEILIGNAAGETGAEGIYGPLIQSGLEFAISQINDDGGVLDGQQLRAELVDNESSQDGAASAFQQLADQGAVAITGPVLSDVAIGARNEAEDLEVPHFPVQGASPQLLTQDTRYTFRTAGLPAPYYAGATGQLLDEMGISTYGAIYADYSYGQSYNAGIEEFIVGREGIDTTVESAPFQAEDFTSQLRAMPDDLEYMDLGGHPVGIFDIIPAMWDLGLEPEGISGPGDPYSTFYDSLGEDIDRGVIQLHSVDPTSDEYVEVGEAYYEETGEYFDPFVAFGYVIANHIAEAIEEAGEADPQSIRDAVSDMSYDSLLAYPLEYNEWGELTEGRLVTMEFTTEAPPYYPDGDFHVETLYTSDPFDPIDPNEWE